MSSALCARTLQTDDKQTDDRRTDDDEREFTFAKNYLNYPIDKVLKIFLIYRSPFYIIYRSNRSYKL